MAQSLRKSINDLVTILKKQTAPGQKKKSIWETLQSQLADEGEWDQKLIKAIEQEADKYLSKFDKKTLIAMWEDSDVALDSGKESSLLSTKEIKEDLVKELVDKVMDRLDSNYSRSNYFDEDEQPFAEEKHDEEEDEFELEEPDEFDDDIKFDDDIFNDDDDLLDDEEDRY
ncbi:hypothetical protein ABRY23_09660 [Melioribacteraceae bacterium 4301-Me]|uniref:hypothetical protein n=1 Tax=Pyranulibacter aquaticus TaxID=3163344 RepID=UPI0035999AC2